MKYQTLLADPPWPMADSGGRTHSGRSEDYAAAGSGKRIDPDWWGRTTGARSKLPYERMTVEAICALPVRELAAKDAHLYLWTTNRFLLDGYRVVEAWGFKASTLLTWCKAPMGLGFGGAYCPTTEFCIYARRGSLKPLRRMDTTWFAMKRPYLKTGGPAHSAKPPAFIDVIETVSPGPYLELFARERRDGWDAWGNEVDSDVEMAS